MGTLKGFTQEQSREREGMGTLSGFPSESVGEHSKDCEAGLQGPVECLEEIMQA